MGADLANPVSEIGREGGAGSIIADHGKVHQISWCDAVVPEDLLCQALLQDRGDAEGLSAFGRVPVEFRLRIHRDQENRGLLWVQDHRFRSRGKECRLR